MDFLSRKRVEFGLVDTPNNTVSDDNLVSIIDNIQQNYPDVGESMAIGYILYVLMDTMLHEEEYEMPYSYTIH